MVPPNLPTQSVFSIIPPLNFFAQFNDACPPSSVMMDGVISILVSTLNLKPKHMVWQMFHQWALLDLPCRCSLTLDLHDRILIFKLQYNPCFNLYTSPIHKIFLKYLGHTFFYCNRDKWLQVTYELNQISLNRQDGKKSMQCLKATATYGLNNTTSELGI